MPVVSEQERKAGKPKPWKLASAAALLSAILTAVGVSMVHPVTLPAGSVQVSFGGELVPDNAGVDLPQGYCCLEIYSAHILRGRSRLGADYLGTRRVVRLGNWSYFVEWKREAPELHPQL